MSPGESESWEVIISHNAIVVTSGCINKATNIHHMSRRKAKLEAKDSRGHETSSHPDGMESRTSLYHLIFFLKTPYEFNPNHGHTNGTLDPASMEFYSAWICRGALVLEGKDYWNMCLLFNLQR